MYFDITILYCGDDDVTTTNDCGTVESESISTLTTIIMPAATWMVVGLAIRSEQHREVPMVSTSRRGCPPSCVETASTVMAPSFGATTNKLLHT